MRHKPNAAQQIVMRVNKLALSSAMRLFSSSGVTTGPDSRRTFISIRLVIFATTRSYPPSDGRRVSVFLYETPASKMLCSLAGAFVRSRLLLTLRPILPNDGRKLQYATEACVALCRRGTGRRNTALFAHVWPTLRRAAPGRARSTRLGLRRHGRANSRGVGGI